MRLLLTGGGTAGHIYPLLSIVEELKQKLKDERLEILYVGSRGGIEESILKRGVENQNISTILIYSGKWRRYWKKWPFALIQNFIDFFKVIIGFFQAFFIVVKFRPEVIMAKGGYVTVPVIFAALFCRVPIITHESDIVMGLSNRICARFAKKIFVSFPISYYKGIPKEKMVETGNPIRREFYQIDHKNNKDTEPKILIAGGSQGSHNINHMIFGILPDLLEISEITHVTGSLDFREAEEKRNNLAENLKSKYSVFEYLDEEWPKVVKESDLIISRSGANTLSEIAASAKPSILIPLPTSASDHQTKNAEIFEQNEAALLLREEKLSPQVLLEKIRDLLKNKELQGKMSENAKKLSNPKAASKIVEEIIELRR